MHSSCLNWLTTHLEIRDYIFSVVHSRRHSISDFAWFIFIPEHFSKSNHKSCKFDADWAAEEVRAHHLAMHIARVWPQSISSLINFIPDPHSFAWLSTVQYTIHFINIISLKSVNSSLRLRLALWKCYRESSDFHFNQFQPFVGELFKIFSQTLGFNRFKC